MKNKYPSWYQVRIFARPDDKDTAFNWSLRIYGDIIKKFVNEFPKVRFWFTKYQTYRKISCSVNKQKAI
jgi:hypothetical protein